MTTDPSGFERLYQERDDPWEFATSPYEQARYATTVQALGSQRFTRAFEPGCSVGVLTAMLAERCGELVACDVSPTACAAARRRTAAATNVQIVNASTSAWWPDGSFDLVVLSELGYYWNPMGVAELAERTDASLEEQGVVLAVHWLGHSDDHAQHGAAVHDQLEQVLGRPELRTDVDPLHTGEPAQMFVIERWRRG